MRAASLRPGPAGPQPGAAGSPPGHGQKHSPRSPATVRTARSVPGILKSDALAIPGQLSCPPREQPPVQTMNSTRLFHPLALTSRQESEKNDIATTCWFVAYEVASGRSLLLLMFGAVLAFLLSFARHN